MSPQKQSGPIKNTKAASGIEMLKNTVNSKIKPANKFNAAVKKSETPAPGTK